MAKWTRIAVFLLALATATVRAAEDEASTDSCTADLVHSYRLYPSKDVHLSDPFYICPFFEKSCCSFDSQKMIQILWIRISQPRLQRILTHSLTSLEFIISSLKGIMGVYGRNRLPKNKKYSAECLQSLDDMQELIDANLGGTLDEMFEQVKLGFNNLYKFKRQFYCDICNQANHGFFNVINKRVDFSVSFCQKFAEDFVPIAAFLTFDLIRHFKTVKNYVQCYTSKNFLFLPSLDDFRVAGEDKNVIDQCRDKRVCAPFCQRYSLTELPDILIGNKDNYDRMVFFLKHHKPDPSGYFTSEPDYVRKYNEMLLQEHLENLRDAGRQVDAEEENKLNAKMFFEQQNLKREAKPGNAQEIEKAMMELYKNSFEFFRSKFVQAKMKQIKTRIAEEYDDKMVRQNFLVTNDATINLDEYRVRLMEKGLDPYLLLDQEKMYVTNANLTLFTKEITNTVADLLYLNETKIMDQMVETGKLMQTDAGAKEAVASFIKSKIFEKEAESQNYLVENPYIDTRSGVGALASLAVVLLALLFTS